MGKKQASAIDSLFGSKTRVKLLHLFYSNPGKSFYVREITRLIDEQINSVRRELSNMLEVGVIISDTADHKLYYQVNQRYEYYAPFRAIFAPADRASVSERGRPTAPAAVTEDIAWKRALRSLKGVRVVVAAGVLVDGSASGVDLVVAGAKSQKLMTLIEQIEKEEARELNYVMMSYDELYYRLSVRDRFVTELLANRHEVIVDGDNVLKGQV